MVDIFSQIKTKQQFEINALIFDRTTNDYRFEQSDFFRVYRCLWFEPNWFYSGARWNQLNTGRWINHLECHQCLPLNLQSLATLAVGCRHSTDRRLERSLRLHLVSPDAWDDELPHIQFDVLDSIRLWNLIQQTLTRPFPFHKNYEPTPACRIKCTAIDRDTPLHSNAMQMFQLQAHLNLADERANSLRKFVQQSATMFRLLAAADSSQVRSPTDIGRFHNLKENKALRIVEQHLNRKAEDESHQEDFRLSQTCDRNEQTLTYLTNSLHLHVIEIHKALTMCMFEASQESISSSVASKSIDSDATLKPPSLNKGLPNQKKAAKSKVAFTLNTSLIDQDRTYWKDESNQKKADTGQSDSIQLIVNSVKRFLVNLDRIVYIDRNNPLTVGT